MVCSVRASCKPGAVRLEDNVPRSTSEYCGGRPKALTSGNSKSSQLKSSVRSAVYVSSRLRIAARKPRAEDRGRRRQSILNAAATVDVQETHIPLRPDGREVDGEIWQWKPDIRIHYVCAGSAGPPLVLVPGFGVGEFHWRRNIEELSQHHRVYAIDLLGQGCSWPIETPLPTRDPPLQYSMATWVEQLSDFCEEAPQAQLFASCAQWLNASSGHRLNPSQPATGSTLASGPVQGQL
ncbi:hypothetical protein CYMTET_14248 [Cymbomonas tetramitiformis]|uniref:AB hydrolase-1 domain-containing protein n=1 Tax=Cymbomonas tetramitiformis TaxID=36881 RepID=A0AAE0GGD6_9CHLO|nr:hypothetical protein CYMTET_14248 [Cymbomonas tetramitiformis]